MLATLVIGLREGLEASLIVGIIAAFLRRTGKPLRPMWIGVGVAVALSIAVGVALRLVSASLPQAQQEGMESIIGLVAVTAVTGMIGWMNVHARTMRADLELTAAKALGDGTAWALVAMAFLAVLKEGFETSVFLLAAFQSSTSVLDAGAGAVIGVAIAVGIGIGIFRGGVHLNLARFFRITGMFLVLVAAGLVLSALRTAHEAGWIQIGQQTTLNLTWLAPSGSVQAALLTGVLGIPADPRLIEVLGWLAYLVPTMLFLLWPQRRRPSGRALAVVRFAIAGGLVIIAAVLALAVSLPSYSPPATAEVADADGLRTAVAVPVELRDAVATTHEGLPAQLVTTKHSAAPTDQPTVVSLDELVNLNGGRLPIGVNAAENPGPFAASWLTSSTTRIWVYRAGILDAERASITIVTLSGGGLASARTISPDAAQAGSWRLPAATRDAVVSRAISAKAAAAERLLWKMWIPIVLALAALVLALCALRTLHFASRRSSRSLEPQAKENYA
jgi:high-affinity iron transporter